MIPAPEDQAASDAAYETLRAANARLMAAVQRFHAARVELRTAEADYEVASKAIAHAHAAWWQEK